MKNTKTSNRGWHWLMPCLGISMILGGVLYHTPSRVFGEDASLPSPATATAFEQNQRLGRGINILGYDPLWKSPAEARFQEGYFKLIRDAGFDHVRVNLHPFRDARTTSDVGDHFWKTLDWVVQKSLNNHLAVILDFHEYHAMASDPIAKKERFLAVWKQIAERCKDAPREVFFEMLNEPNGQLTSALWNPLLREALATIRETNPNRTVIVGPDRWNSITALKDLDLPDGDRDLIVTVHYYRPHAFTCQGAPWTDQKNTSGVTWEGTEQQCRAVAGDFEKAQAWAKTNQRPLYLGEFGAYDKADMPSRARYVNFVARQAEKMGWSWAYWQFDSDFIAYDVKNQHWIQPILDALIPQR